MRSIKQPIAPIEVACRNLSLAVDAHLDGRLADAAAHFVAADCPEVWAWVNPAWSRADLNVQEKAPENDTRVVGWTLRDPIRHPVPAVRAEVLARDGYRCRYCGIPVVSADIRKLAHRLYPDAVRWGGNDPAKQHAGFQCLWLQYDHVVPHSHGGRSTSDNVVIRCALCNFGKDRFTLRQLGIDDPRAHQPQPFEWDGLERFRGAGIGLPRIRRASTKKVSSVATDKGRKRETYFLADARISKGYVLAPNIQGKDRWFRLSEDVEAEAVIYNGIAGVRLSCQPRLMFRRGIHTGSLTRLVEPSSGATLTDQLGG